MSRVLWKRYEIWVGYYHLGQGYDPPAKPELVAVIRSSSFKLACYEHEISSRLEIIHRAKLDGEDIHTYKDYYNPETMTNSWIGKYYPSEKEAWTSFK